MAAKQSTKIEKSKKAAKAKAAPAAEQANTAGAAPAKTKGKKTKEPKAKKTSALDAAVRVLEEAGKPIAYPEMIEKIASACDSFQSLLNSAANCLDGPRPARSIEYCSNTAYSGSRPIAAGVPREYGSRFRKMRLMPRGVLSGQPLPLLPA